ARRPRALGARIGPRPPRGAGAAGRAGALGARDRGAPAGAAGGDPRHQPRLPRCLLDAGRPGGARRLPAERGGRLRRDAARDPAAGRRTGAPVTAALALSGVFGAGLWLIVLGQPLGRPRPDLARRLRRLSAQGRMELDAGMREPVFESALLERALRPLLDDAGRAIGTVLRRLGLETSGLDRRLALAMPGVTPAQFHGQQLATGLVAAAVFPLLNLLGAHPAGPWPVWLWLAAFAAGFAAPS